MSEGSKIGAAPGLGIGREIFKDFYISYDKGLTDSAGTFRPRFDLK